jgi:hypothetical protein
MGSDQPPRPPHGKLLRQPHFPYFKLKHSAAAAGGRGRPLADVGDLPLRVLSAYMRALPGLPPR